MIFKHLSLKNFKSYKNSKISFDKGISIIVGENGAGKSSIFEAISFALFKQHGAKKIDDLVRNGSNENMEIELEFTSNGKDYKIIRTKEKSGLKSKLLKKHVANGEYMPLCVGDREVATEINSILAIDSDLFLNAIYIRQGEIAELVNKTPSEKKKLIAKLLGLDSLEKAWSNIQPIISNYENALAELKGKIEGSSDLEKERSEKIDFLNELKDKGHDLEEKLSEIKLVRENNRADKIHMEREKEIYDNFISSLESEKKSLTILETDIVQIQESLDEINNSEDQMDELEKSVKKLPLYLDFQKYVSNIQQLKEEEETILDNLQSIKTQKSTIEREKGGYSKYTFALKTIEELKDKKLAAEKDLVGIAKIENEKSEIISAIEESKNSIEEFFAKAINQLTNLGIEEDIIDRIDNLNNLNIEVDNFLESISTKVADINEDIISKNEEIVKLKESIKVAEKPLEELDRVDNVCPVCQSDIDSRKKRELVDYYQYTIDQSKRLMEEDEETINLLKSNKEKYEEKEEKIKDLAKDIMEHNYEFRDLEKNLEKLEKLDEELQTKENTNNKLAKIILNISQSEKECEEYKKSYEDYTKAKGALEVLGNQIEIEDKLKEIANEIDANVRNIQTAVEQDKNLTTSLTTKELEDIIEDLKAKDAQYNQLKGFIKTKESLESQLISKKEEVDWKYNKIDSLKENIKNSEYDKEQYNELLYSYELFEKKEKDCSAELSSIKGQSKELIAQVNNLTEKINLNNSIKVDYDNTNDYLSVLTKIRELYSKNGIQKDLRNFSKPLIQKYTKEYFNMFNFDYSDLILDDEYNVTVYGPEGESKIDMVSGGERIAIALALRLGITRSLSECNLETILLDEPTVHLDSFRKHELINLLKEITLLPQMIIVTHESQLENAADNLIKVEKNNGISEIKT
ncbi:MAG: SMC family ATPase, partial [Methanobrevibacter sp.]|nr:SMC family ATPase [Methanobrevibacter sp.]